MRRILIVLFALSLVGCRGLGGLIFAAAVTATIVAASHPPPPPPPQTECPAVAHGTIYCPTDRCEDCTLTCEPG